MLMTVFLVLIIGIGFLFARIYNNSGILYIAVFFSIFMNVFSYWYSDKIALKMTGARQIEKNDKPELFRIVENLAITAGLKMPKVCIIEDSAPNAFATGRNQEHSAVAVTTGLLERLNKTEVEGVIAHELSHIGNKDILISTIVVVLVGFIAIISDMFLRFSFFHRGGDRDNKGNALLFFLGIIAALLAPIAATLIQLTISRKREFLADSSGALLTRYPEGLASALEKISNYPYSMKKASNATAHMFISNPFKGVKAGKLFMTHPPAEERVAVLRGMKV